MLHDKGLMNTVDKFEYSWGWSQHQQEGTADAILAIVVFPI